MSDDILLRLMEVLASRKDANPESSYVAGLFHKGLDSILKKIGEESAETIIAAKSGDKQQIVYETARELRFTFGSSRAHSPRGGPHLGSRHSGKLCISKAYRYHHSCALDWFPCRENRPSR